MSRITPPLVVVPDTDLEPILHRLAEDDLRAAGCCVPVRHFVDARAEPLDRGDWRAGGWIGVGLDGEEFR